MIGVLCNSLFLGPSLLMHFSTEYSAFAFVPVHYIVISFPLSFAGAGSQGQRYQAAAWLSRSSADLVAVAAAVGASPGLLCLFSQPASRPPAW